MTEPGRFLTEEQFDKWLIALKSGEYAKGQGYLEMYGHYCCLGVLDSLYPTGTDSSAYLSIDSSSRSKSCLIPTDIQLILAMKNDTTDDYSEVIGYLENNKSIFKFGEKFRG